MLELFHANLLALYFIYGLCFYTMGLAIALQYRSYSTFRLAYSLSLLAGFGVLHGIGEWGNVFVPVQIPEMSYLPVWKLLAVQRILLALSHLLLLTFGTKLLCDTKAVSQWIYLFPTGLFLAWMTAFSRFVLFIDTPDMMGWLLLSENWSRYLLALPGGALTAYTLHLQTDELKRLGRPEVLLNLRVVTVAFASFAFFSGLVVPANTGWLSSFLNAGTFKEATGLPVEVFRALTAIVATASISKMLAVFEIEKERQVSQSRRLQAIAAERERFSRDLHDGIIQSLYGIGVSLQGAAMSVPKSSQEAGEKINGAVRELNEVVKTLRQYIAGLDSPAGDLRKAIEDVARSFEKHYAIRVGVLWNGGDLEGIDGPDQSHLIQIVREALSNAARHGTADDITIEVEGSPGQLLVSIRDNGTGLPSVEGLERHGLANMRQRAALMGGRVSVSRRAEGGTEITLSIPIASQLTAGR